jgi:putative ABC transport system ATP-binding protein
MLKLTDVSKVHVTGEVQTTALNKINLEIAKGEYVAITGPSGCGKSTLLSLLGLLDVPDSGSFRFEGQAVEGMSEARLNALRRGRVGFIFQSFNLIEELSVEENVALALEYGDLGAAERRTRVADMLDKLGVGHRAKHTPSQLSGGQQQRVAIARALVARPAILFADEPTGNLDTAHGDEVMNLLRAIHAEGTTIVMVTHSIAHAHQATRTVHMLDGKIQSDQLRAAA